MAVRRPLSLGLVVSLVSALSACVAPHAGEPDIRLTQDNKTRSTTPATTVRPPSPQPAVSSAPSTAPTIAPSPTPLPAAPVLSGDDQRIKDAAASQLLAIARVGFNQNRSTLLSDRGAAVIANNGLGLISDKGMGVISNNSGGLIANNSAGYHVAQAATTITADALADEVLFIDRHWPDGSRTFGYTKATDADHTYYRRVDRLTLGQPVEETLAEVTLGTSGKPVEDHERHTVLYPDGTLALTTAYTRIFDTSNGLQTQITVDPGTARSREARSGLAVDVEALTLNADTGAGSFRYRYTGLGLVETGTLSGVARDAHGDLPASAFDPLAFYDGQSRVEDADGKLLYTRKRTTAGGTITYEYGLDNGLTATLSPTANGGLTGTLTENGKAIAKLEQTRRADGSVLFSLYFQDQPNTPLVVGYGITAYDVPPKADPAPVGWTVSTLAGAAEAGTADGTGTTARFKSLAAIVRSRKTPNRYYLADTAGNRIRMLTLNGTTAEVATYAGDGQSGDTNGARLSARFNQPLGLAIAADDTLYVSDAHRIRKIAPDGTVSTLAGTGTAGFVNGKGTAARFSTPAGLALGADGTLYVADMANHRLRKVAADGTVTTLVGDGVAGLTDGPIASARLNQPSSLAVDGGGTLYVVDVDRVRAVTAAGQVSTVAGGGSPLATNLDGTATNGELTAPGALAVGSDGQLYLGGRDIRRINAQGIFSSVAGLGGGGYADGPVAQAAFGGILGLAFTDQGAVIATDGTLVRLVAPPSP